VFKPVLKNRGSKGGGKRPHVRFRHWAHAPTLLMINLGLNDRERVTSHKGLGNLVGAYRTSSTSYDPII